MLSYDLRDLRYDSSSEEYREIRLPCNVVPHSKSEYVYQEEADSKPIYVLGVIHNLTSVSSSTITST